MSIIKKVLRHLSVILVLSLVFAILWTIGNEIIVNTTVIKYGEYYKFNIPFHYTFVTGLMICLPAYIIYLLANLTLSRVLAIKDHLILNTLKMVSSIFAFAIIFLAYLPMSFGADFSKPYVIKNLLVILTVCLLTPFIEKLIVRTFSKQIAKGSMS